MIDCTLNRRDRRARLANARNVDPWNWEDRSHVAHMFPHAAWGQCVACHLTPVYSVQIFQRHTDWGRVDHYAIRRHDGKADIPWRDKQRIKSDLAGPGATAIEVFPAESDLTDQANMYHLWVLPAGFDLPFGLETP